LKEDNVPGSAFSFVKEDKDKDEKPKATDVIEFLLKRELTVNTAST
jgi:hypothetical protein